MGVPLFLSALEPLWLQPDLATHEISNWCQCFESPGILVLRSRPKVDEVSAQLEKSLSILVHFTQAVGRPLLPKAGGPCGVSCAHSGIEVARENKLFIVGTLLMMAFSLQSSTGYKCQIAQLARFMILGNLSTRHVRAEQLKSTLSVYRFRRLHASGIFRGCKLTSTATYQLPCCNCTELNLMRAVKVIRTVGMCRLPL